MRRPLKAISSTASTLGAVLALTLALAGCGSSAAKKEANIPLTSSAIEGTKLPARYTCDGANIAPAFKWGAVPTGTRELVLFAIGKAQASHAPSTIEWAMAGLKPELGEVTAGKVPTGAFLEEASNGKRHYSICPPRGQSRLYAFALYAVPEKVIVTPNVNGTTLFHNLAEGKPEFRATASGEITASYTRK
jgi:phosphatidylethanolamine-binding protein (PEBP) family uncharacterized protein